MPEASTIEYQVCVIEVEVAQQKICLASFPLKEHVTVMLAIAKKTKEIIAAWAKQQST